MSTTTAAPPDGAGSTDPTARDVWRAARAPLAVIGLVLLAGLVLAVVAGGAPQDPLDPRSVSPEGSRAVAELLRDQGVDVRRTTRIREVQDTAGPGTTVLVAQPDLVVGSQAGAVRGTGADLVLVDAHNPERFVDGVRAVDDDPPEVREPVCRLRAAAAAGRADTAGVAYEADVGGEADAELCYAEDGRASVVQVREAARTVTVLGSSELLTNARLDEEGNAALALNLLGARDRLVWYLPSVADLPSGEARSPYELIPDGIWWALVQVMVAVLLLALWRARRLGPVVREPLPVVVRAAEAVEGRARLYRRGRARGRAAEALRGGVRRRLVPMLGLPRGSGPGQVIDAVAARSARTPPDVGALLYGAAPPDDAALVRLADDLDALEREVRRS